MSNLFQFIFNSVPSEKCKRKLPPCEPDKKSKVKRKLHFDDQPSTQNTTGKSHSVIKYLILF